MSEHAERFEAEKAERQAKEDALAAERIEAATVARDEFNEERRAKVMNVTMKANREKEHEKMEEIQRQLENENPWERIISLVDLQPDTSDQACDMSRARTNGVPKNVSRIGISYIHSVCRQKA